MKDEEMERARECLGKLVAESGRYSSVASHAFATQGHDIFILASDAIELAVAFAQQPEGWRLDGVWREAATANARKLIYGTPALQEEARRWWTAELSNQREVVQPNRVRSALDDLDKLVEAWVQGRTVSDEEGRRATAALMLLDRAMLDVAPIPGEE